MNYIGVHINDNNYDTILNALKIANNIGARVLQIFVGDKILTTLRKKYVFSKEEEMAIKKFLKATGMRLYVHAILTINLCNDPEYPRYKWMTDNIIHDMKQCKKIGACGVVVHCGSYKTKTVDLSRDICMKHFKTAIKILLKAVPGVNLIIETPVNREYGVGGTIRDLNELYQSSKKKIKFCIDTQHIFASGVDLNEYFSEFDSVIGLKNVGLIHLNDSAKEFGLPINRHQSMGKGYLFSKKNRDSTELLKYILQTANKNKIDMVMETDFNGYKKDIQYLKKIESGLIVDKNIKTKLIKRHTGSGKRKNIKSLILKIFNALLFNYQNKLANGTSNIIVRYKIDSYQKAIHSIEKYPKPIYSSNDVKDLEYIGKGMCEKIDEIADSGSLRAYNNIKNNKTIDSYHVFSGIWGFGDTMVKRLIAQKIYTIPQLKTRIKRNEIKLTHGQTIGLKYHKALSQKIPLTEITEITQKLNRLIEDKNCRLHNAGSYRTGAEMCGDIDLILTCKSLKDVNRAPTLFHNILTSQNMLKETLLSGEKKSIYIIKSPLNSQSKSKKTTAAKTKSTYYKIDISYILEDQLPWYLLYFGSSREFSKKIRTIASKKGYKLNEKGLADKKTGKMIDFQPRDEKEIFDFLEIEYVDVKDRY